MDNETGSDSVQQQKQSFINFNPPINEIADYVFARNIKAYLRQKRMGRGLRELMACTPYKNITKFDKHLDEWLALVRPIPKTLLTGLGVDWDVLSFCYELDCENFQKAIEIPRYPEHFVVRLIPGIYSTKDLPKGVSEEEAIEIVKEYSSGRFRCLISYPQLLTIYIEPNGRVRRSYYKPEFVKGRGPVGEVVYFGSDGRFIGTTRIGGSRANISFNVG